MDIERNWSRFAMGALIGLALAGCTSTPKANSSANATARPSAAPVNAASKGATATTTRSTQGTVILCSAESATRILAGTQTSTTRKGVRTYPLGPATMESGRRRIAIEITQLKGAKFADLTEADARSGGLATLDELKTALKTSYPDVQDSDEMTTVYFRLKPVSDSPSSRAAATLPTPTLPAP